MSLTRIVNNLLSVLGFRIVRKNLLYDWQTGEGNNTPALRLPEGGFEYLSIDNPRLQQLRQDYSQFQSKVSVPIVWTDEYAQSFSLRSFRGDNCYVWQTKDPNCDEINYCLTTYFVKAIDTHDFLQKNTEDGLFGVYTYTVNSQLVSRDLLDSVLELSFLEKQLCLSQISNLKILDIGAGYGRLAFRAVTALPNLTTYLCADAVPESTFLSEYHVRFRHLEDRVVVVPLDQITERLQEQHIDLAVNIHSFSECTLDAIDWWLSLLAANKVKYFFIVPNAADHGGKMLALNNGVDFSFVIEKYGYRLHCKSPKYEDPLVQKYGVSPTYYYLYQLVD